MATLALTRSREDRKRYDLAGYGSLRRTSLTGSRGEVRPDGGTQLRTERTGILRPVLRATDDVGSVVGEFRATGLGSSGDLTWRGESLRLRSTSWLRARYVLERAGDALVRLEVKGWGREPVRVDVVDLATEPALVLFAVAVARNVSADSDGGGAAAVS